MRTRMGPCSCHLPTALATTALISTALFQVIPHAMLLQVIPHAMLLQVIPYAMLLQVIPYAMLLQAFALDVRLKICQDVRRVKHGTAVVEMTRVRAVLAVYA